MQCKCDSPKHGPRHMSSKENVRFDINMAADFASMTNLTKIQQNCQFCQSSITGILSSLFCATCTIYSASPQLSFTLLSSAMAVWWQVIVSGWSRNVLDFSRIYRIKLYTPCSYTYLSKQASFLLLELVHKEIQHLKTIESIKVPMKWNEMLFKK